MKLRKDRKVIRKQAADERAEHWNALSPAKQLSELDRRLGVGIGATRQRARLSAALEPVEAKKKKKKL